MPVDTVADDARVGVELAGLDNLELAGGTGARNARRLWSATWPKVFALAVAVGGWQLLVATGWKPRYALAGPDEVWPVLREQLSDGVITTALRITMQRAVVGYALALVIGVAVGMVVSRSRVLRSGVGSLITGLQTMPSVAWFPLAILLFRISEEAILFVVVLGAAPSIANGLIAGVDNVPPLLDRAGRVLGARGLAAWRHVRLPAAMPTFIGGLKQGWAFSWRSLMAGELLVIVPGQASLGFLLQNARELNDSAGLLAAMVVVLAVGIAVDALVFGAAERAVHRRWGLAPA
jgi:NitT/TauT family transport system permease protein